MDNMGSNAGDGCGAFSVVSCVSLVRETARSAHEFLETRLNAILENISPSEYESLLCKFFGFYQPMEARLTVLAKQADFPPEFELRSKASLLAGDLLALGRSESFLRTVPLCQWLPELRTTAQALGAIYVFEGAALGGQVIAPRLRSRLGITPQNGGAFFTGTGRE
jgi:heme oxygenase